MSPEYTIERRNEGLPAPSGEDVRDLGPSSRFLLATVLGAATHVAYEGLWGGGSGPGLRVGHPAF